LLLCIFNPYPLYKVIEKIGCTTKCKVGSDFMFASVGRSWGLRVQQKDFGRDVMEYFYLCKEYVFEFGGL
jgi:hypothetical protein